MDSLSGISVFALVAETRNFTTAGRELGVSSSAIGKTIARLETKLGVRLFNRNTRSITLTPEGVVFLERCYRILEEVQAAERELSELSGRPSGRLRISVPNATPFTMRLLAGFMKQYPDVELDIDQTGRGNDVIEAGFDAAVRLSLNHDLRLASRSLGTYERVLVGAPDYFKRRGTPRAFDELAGHSAIYYRLPGTGKAEPCGSNSSSMSLPESMKEAVVCNGVDGVLLMTKMGAGLALLPQFLVQPALEAGELVRVLSSHQFNSVTLSLVWPKSRQDTPKLRALIDYLGQHPIAAAEAANAHHLVEAASQSEAA